ncbi:hypothetical protein R6Q59_018113 [Mikania micrantha]
MLSPGLHNGGWYCNMYLSYNYSKSELANGLKERIQEPKLMTLFRKTVFQYPTLADLKIETFTSLQTYVLVEVLSSGPVFRSNDSRFNEVSNCHVFNISLNLIFIEDPNKVDEESYRHVSKLYLEGVYDQQVGKMYLIACRKVDFDHVDLERGLDCLIEVTIEYSPLNTRWLINPTAKITITSQRNENDTYNFNSIRLKTFMIPDKHHEQNVIFRNIFEGYFRVFLLLMCIALILNQIKNMKKSLEPVAYISLLALALWIVGYGITLIYSEEILIKSSETERYRKQPYDLQNYKRYLNNLDYIARFLVLISMFLMVMISQMVLKARKALDEKSKPTPSEKKLLLVCLVAYLCDFLIGFSSKVGIHLYVDKVNLTKDDYMNIIMQMFLDSVHDLQDWSVVAQVIAPMVWKHRLSGLGLESFLIGLWIPSLIRIPYVAFRDPVSYPFFN